MKYTYSGSDLNQQTPARRPADRTTPPNDRKSGFGAGAFVGIVLVVAVLAGGAWWFLREKTPLSNVTVDQPVTRMEQASGTSAQEAKSKLSDRDMAVYLYSSEKDVEQLFEYVRNSSFVKGNLQYAEKMKSVRFVYSLTNDDVNAYASIDQKDPNGRLINCFAGETYIAKVCALAAAAEMCGKKGSIAKLMEKLSPKLCFHLTIDDAAGLIRECGLDSCLLDEAIRAKAKSIAAGQVVGTLAHETGHIVLGHLEAREAKINLNNEVRRNNETQADLFASSVMSSSPFGEYVFLGRVFYFWVNMQKTDPLFKKSVPNSELDHPLNRERYVSYVLSNKEKAVAFGFPIPEL